MKKPGNARWIFVLLIVVLAALIGMQMDHRASVARALETEKSELVRDLCKENIGRLADVVDTALERDGQLEQSGVLASRNMWPDELRRDLDLEVLTEDILRRAVKAYVRVSMYVSILGSKDKTVEMAREDFRQTLERKSNTSLFDASMLREEELMKANANRMVWIRSLTSKDVEKLEAARLLSKKM